MQVAVDIVTDEVRELKFDLAAPGNDLALRAHVKSFKAPQINVTLNSESLDLDQLLPPPPKTQRELIRLRRELALFQALIKPQVNQLQM